ncbi:MAG: trypsin-like serine protease [Planctomycetota bacterium]
MRALVGPTALAGTLFYSGLARAVVTSGAPGHLPQDRITAAGTPINGIDHDGVGFVETVTQDPVTDFIAGSSGSASLLWTGRHLLTAAHVITNNQGMINVSPSTNPVFTSKITFNTTAGDLVYEFRYNPQRPNIFIHPNWDGSFLDGGDLAIIDLGQTVDEIVPRYNIYTGDTANLIDTAYTQFGYGRSGIGTQATNFGGGTKRWGMNTIDLAQDDKQLLNGDFDNGNTANDYFGALDFDTYGGFEFATGLGDVESGIAQGDSGSAAFITIDDENYLFGVPSYGIADIREVDVTDALDFSFGESFGFASTSPAQDWIFQAVAIPEPGALTLTLVGAATVLVRQRRRRH